MKVEQLMTRDVKVCTTADSLNRAAQLMWESDVGCVPVLDADGNGGVAGFLTDRDIAMAAYIKGAPLTAIPVSSAMAKAVIACHTGDGISQAEALMRDNQIRRLPVLDQNERMVGIISLNDIAREARRERAVGRAEVNADDLAETLASVSEPHGAHEIQTAG